MRFPADACVLGSWKVHLLVTLIVCYCSYMLLPLLLILLLLSTYTLDRRGLPLMLIVCYRRWLLLLLPLTDIAAAAESAAPYIVPIYIQ